MRKPDGTVRERLPGCPVPGHSAACGFTLVELLVVMGIIAIIAAISVPALNSIQGTYNLDSVGQGVSAQISLARQNAVASNRPVQVRFYQIADYNGSTATPVYRAMQSFIEGETTVSGTTTTTPVTSISKPYFFPQPVIVLNTVIGGNDASSLLDYNVTKYSGIQNVAAGDTGNPLPPPYNAASYTYFRFRANGQVDQSTSGTTAWTSGTLTFVLETAPIIGATGLPANYVSVTLNAITGTVRVFDLDV